MIKRLSIAVLLLSALVAISRAQTSYPMIMSLKPVAAQVGQTSERTIRSRYNMLGAYEVLVTGEGVTGEIIPPEVKEDPKDKKPNVQEIKVRFTITPEAKPGVRDFRLASPQGASTIGQLVVVQDKVVSEASDNDTIKKAQLVELPATLCGTIEKAEDVDFYRFNVESGTTLNLHVRSNRLQNKIHDLQQHSDPILTLRNSSGTTLAASDNYFYGDPFISHHFEHAGEYLLEIRDVRYQGNTYWEYSIEINSRPFVTNVFPMGLSPGEQAELKLVGFQLPDNPIARLQIPMDAKPNLHWMAVPMGESVSNPAPVIISDLQVVNESDSNNGDASGAQMISIPAGLNGRIEKEGDIDCFVFEAKKDEVYNVEIIARRHQSALDSHLRILNEAGKQLQLNDDMRRDKRSYADSLIENWTVPADGKYVIEVRDLHLRGGAPFVYFVQLTPSEPCFEIYADTDKTLLTPGTSGVVYIRAVRKHGFQGEIQLGVEGLGTGVTADCGRILAEKGQDGCIILHAADDAPMGISNVAITGTARHDIAEGQSQTLTANALTYQEIYMPGGGRGHFPVEMHSVSVGAPSDILSVSLNETEVTLKPGESKKIDVTIERAEGFDKNITLDVIYKHLSSVYGNSLPEGVSLDGNASKTLLTGKTTEGHITLKAAEGAPPVDRQQVPVMANVSINFVMKATYSSKPLFISVSSE